MDSIKRHISLLLLILIASSAFGQMKSGVIIFERKTNLLKKYKNEQSRKWLGDKKVKIDKFELHFTPTESFFVPVKVVEEGRMLFEKVVKSAFGINVASAAKTML